MMIVLLDLSSRSAKHILIMALIILLSVTACDIFQPAQLLKITNTDSQPLTIMAGEKTYPNVAPNTSIQFGYSPDKLEIQISARDESRIATYKKTYTAKELADTNGSVSIELIRITNDKVENWYGPYADLGGTIHSFPEEMPFVRIYWGPIDGGTSEQSWENCSYLGPTGLGCEFKGRVGTLRPNTTYYYRCYAYNSVSTRWAPNSNSFTSSDGFYSDFIHVGTLFNFPIINLTDETLTATWTCRNWREEHKIPPHIGWNGSAGYLDDPIEQELLIKKETGEVVYRQSKTPDAWVKHTEPVIIGWPEILAASGNSGKPANRLIKIFNASFESADISINKIMYSRGPELWYFFSDDVRSIKVTAKNRSDEVVCSYDVDSEGSIPDRVSMPETGIYTSWWSGGSARNSLILAYYVICKEENNPSLRLYWGTQDGGISSEKWEHCDEVGSLNNLSPAEVRRYPPLPIKRVTLRQLVKNLTPGTRYFFRGCATTGTITSWEISTKSFETLP
jgi:hypothetical protein